MSKSINRRMYYRIVTTVTCLWLLVVLGVAWVIKNETDEIFDSSLQELGQRVLTLAILQMENTDYVEQEKLQPVAHDEYLTYQIFDEYGRLRIRSHDAPATAFSAPHTVGFHNINGQRYYVDTTSDRRYWIQIAEPADHRRHTITHVWQFLLLPLLLLLPLCVAVIYLSVRDANKSFALFVSKIAERRSANLRPLETNKLPIELHPISDAVNALMVRLKQALDAELSLVANSAHELRTPIASAIIQLDLLRSSDLPTTAMQRVDGALEKLRGLQTTAVKLLQLTRAESGVALSMNPVNLTQIIELIGNELRFQSRAAHRYTLPDQPVWVLGDLDTLGIAVHNLMENAGKYASPDTDIDIELSEKGVLSIKNDCEAISTEQLAVLTRPFVRANTGLPGSGIGLAIVNTVAEHCKAELALRSPCFENGRGFEVSLRFQLALLS